MAPRVLHVMEALGGGTARHLIDVVRHTPGIEHEVAIPRRRVGWLSDDTAVEQLREAGARVHLVEMRRQPWHARNATALLQVARIARRRNVDIVHGHSSVGGALGRVAAVGSGAQRFYTPNGVAPGQVSLAIELGLGRITDRVVAVSESEGALITRRRMVPPERVTVIPNGVDLEPPPGRALDLRRTLGIANNVPLVGGLARLVPQKAPEVFIRACAEVGRRVPDAHFVLVGSGILGPLVRSEIQVAGLGARFHLMAEFDRPATVLDELDVFLSTSRFEGGPYAPLEAMRAGVPLVLTAVVGNRDVVEEGVSGRLVPADQPPVIAAVVSELLEDEPQRRRLADAGRARLRAHFDVRRQGAALSRLYLSPGA
jgi:glycosyltransferase involved in cell wall biosynthesis